MIPLKKFGANVTPQSPGVRVKYISDNTGDKG